MIHHLLSVIRYPPSIPTHHHPSHNAIQHTTPITQHHTAPSTQHPNALSPQAAEEEARIRKRLEDLAEKEKIRKISSSSSLDSLPSFLLGDLGEMDFDTQGFGGDPGRHRLMSDDEEMID